VSALLDDPWTKAQIEAAVAPYVGKLRPEELQFMREQLADMLENDERAARLLRAARPRDVEQSGEVGCDPSDDESDAEKAG
jgi:hypothetical protein